MKETQQMNHFVQLSYNWVTFFCIEDFTSETTREKEWDNIGCVHRHTTTVTTWSYGQQKMGELKLRLPR